MRNVYILTGLIGSGKSFWAKEFAKNNSNTLIISKDNLRTMIKGQYVYDQSTERLIKQLANTNILLALLSGYNVIVDETHITKIKRQEIIEFIRANCFMVPEGVKFSLVYFPEKEKNVEKRMESPKGLPRETWQKVYESMLASFEEPIINELPPGGQLMIPDRNQIIYKREL